MKKIVLSLLLTIGVLAEVTNVEVSSEFIESSKIKIVDIRTPTEWEKMGVIPEAYLLTFFGENNEYHIQSFLKDLDEVIGKDEQFAIISNTASRTKLISNFLGNKHNYKVVNLIGGMQQLLKDGYKVEAYSPNTNKETIILEDKKEKIVEEDNVTIE